MSLKTEDKILRVNNQLCYFSMNGKYLAIAFQINLIIKDVKTWNVFRSFVFSDIIEYIEWAPNSEYILCANITKATVQVYSLIYPQWKFKFTEGSAGLESITWSPNSKHLLTLSEFNIQISIWSLEDNSVLHIPNLKSSVFNKLMFSPNDDRLAVIVTDNGHETVDIYKTSHWKISRKLICERLNSISGISWSPNNDLLCIWCSLSDESKLIIYSTLKEKNIGIFFPLKSKNISDVVNDKVRELKGIENVKWSTSGQLLAVIGFNEMIVVLNHITWDPILQLYLEPVISENNYLNKVYKECVVHSKHSVKPSILCSKHTLEEENDRPLNIKIGKIDNGNQISIAKIDILEYSSCGRYLAIKHQLYPSTLWIWDLTADYIDYLLLQNNITAIKWNPAYTHLLVFCECAYIFEWTPDKATCLSTPNSITALNAHWHYNGKQFILYGYNKVAICQIENKS
ncbi:PREDICTED: WD repeat-containing protein WRAP73-like [Polistes dominula]|uniref:WD repeat-containing protein WRAP73-like n=1 Tax=Polistes dominula TaxID=743375 RepID=A0ABM1HV13_POLDO|nr:PREDICTED: WD repeat-containing protein WRAP73-like [Polistes dominula]